MFVESCCCSPVVRADASSELVTESVAQLLLRRTASWCSCTGHAWRHPAAQSIQLLPKAPCWLQHPKLTSSFCCCACTTTAVLLCVATALLEHGWATRLTREDVVKGLDATRDDWESIMARDLLFCWG